MRAVLQRVTHASVCVAGEAIARIGPGLLILLGIARGDTEADAERLAKKTAELRIVADEAGHFNLSLVDTGGEALVVSQFTLLADTRRGRRPSFTQAAPGEQAEPLVRLYEESLRGLGVSVQSGRFGAHMQVALENDGPVTILLESREPEAAQ
jgi:D-tyrosyl-tRNA(Tyr) deacylase